jgi:hypothetical protein
MVIYLSARKERPISRKRYKEKFLTSKPLKDQKYMDIMEYEYFIREYKPLKKSIQNNYC